MQFTISNAFTPFGLNAMQKNFRSIPGKCDLSSFGNYTNKKLHFKKISVKQFKV
jgi:hypothetical protein